MSVHNITKNYNSSYKRLERIAHAEVKRHILPLEVVDPALANRTTRVVKLKAEVDAQDNKRGVDT